jgi:hypothetical protein
MRIVISFSLLLVATVLFLLGHLGVGPLFAVYLLVVGPMVGIVAWGILFAWAKTTEFKAENKRAPTDQEMVDIVAKEKRFIKFVGWAVYLLTHASAIAVLVLYWADHV